MRLTEKIKENDYWDKMELNYGQSNTSRIIDKLGKLEDIMEKYNIKTLEQVESSFIGFVTDYTEEGRKHIGELLKLEDDLGVDLITLFKALKQETLFIKTDFDIKETVKNGEGWGMKDLIFEDGELVIFAQILYPNDITHKEWLTPLRLKLGDYGKSWALTKEELE